MTVMMHGYDHGAGMGWFAMSAILFVSWILILGAIVLLSRMLSRQPHHTTPPAAPPTTPATLLAERFARGEIDKDEYQQRLAVLHSSPPHPKES